MKYKVGDKFRFKSQVGWLKAEIITDYLSNNYDLKLTNIWSSNHMTVTWSIYTIQEKLIPIHEYNRNLPDWF